VLARLAEQRCLEDVELVSTVSGGSLCAALVFACNGMRWPSSAAYLDRVLPAARELMTTQDLQTALIARMLRMPLLLFHTRADELSQQLQDRWSVTGRLSDLPAQQLAGLEMRTSALSAGEGLGMRHAPFRLWRFGQSGPAPYNRAQNAPYVPEALGLTASQQESMPIRSYAVHWAAVNGVVLFG
jgi:NTE family protein